MVLPRLSSLPNRLDSATSSRRSVRTALTRRRPAQVRYGQATRTRAGACSFNSGENANVLPVVEVRRTGTGRTWFFRIERTGLQDGGPARVSRPGPCPHPSHPRPPSQQAPVLDIPAFLLSYERTHCFQSAAFRSVSSTRARIASCRSPRLRVVRCPAHPATGRTPSRAVRSRMPRSRRLRRRRFAPTPRPGGPRALLVVSPSHSFSPSALDLEVWSGECSRGLRLSWRSRHRPPLTSGFLVPYDIGCRHTISGLTALPGLTALGTHCSPMAARAASAFGASGSAVSVSRLLSGPMPSVHSSLRTYDSDLCS